MPELWSEPEDTKLAKPSLLKDIGLFFALFLGAPAIVGGILYGLWILIGWMLTWTEIEFFRCLIGLALFTWLIFCVRFAFVHISGR